MTRPMSAPLILNNSEANSVACEEYEISAPCPLSQLVFNERQFANRSQSDEAMALKCREYAVNDGKQIN